MASVEMIRIRQMMLRAPVLRARSVHGLQLASSKGSGVPHRWFGPGWRLSSGQQRHERHLRCGTKFVGDDDEGFGLQQRCQQARFFVSKLSRRTSGMGQRPPARIQEADFAPQLESAAQQKAESIAQPTAEPTAEQGTSGHAEATASSALGPNTAVSKAEAHQMVLQQDALVVTREYEWGNILLGFEQANRYTLRAPPDGQVVGYIAEETSLGKSLVRNMLRTHRAFKATVLDVHAEPVLVIRRPFFWISTSLFVETPTGELIGEVHMKWHLYRRRYELFVDKKQFASIDEGFLAWDFNMLDETGGRIASINKDFTGFARELFTDARQYVIRLEPKFGDTNLAPGAFRSEMQSDSAGSNLALTSAQRAVALGCAISIDFDYFSLHSSGGGSGFGIPFFMPFPGGSGGDASPEQHPEPSAAEAPPVGGVGPVPTGGESNSPPVFGSAGNEQGSDGGSQWSTFEAAEPPKEESWDSWGGGDDDDGGGDDDDGGGGGFGSLLGGLFGDGSE
ncbi:Phospholipid scramblase family protein [Porphyridium purpureum]|uniref:Phospholipid scramblase family protein n=1 Tax=Porphyridium purpureum TaxID=35688 RepID=A0A5J4Z0K0_PORPP|nr:Phospholipid scramblase family protein [Porphyridium purpureum]|eukprot:POR7164..scf208_2